MSLLPEALAATMLLSLVVYALLGGADFGGGVWDLLATGPRRAAQRALVEHAIAPVWEANHVWLILVVVILFSSFPVAFSTLSIALHVPLLGVLLGVVLRGTAFVFRQYGGAARPAGSPGERPGERRWGRVFAVASTVTPVLLGMAVGAVSSGAVRLSPEGLPTGGWFRPWLGAFPLAVGAFTLALFAFLAAVYLAAEAAGDAALQEDFRRRALAAAAAVAATALLAALAAPPATEVRRAVVDFGHWWSWPLHVTTGVVAASAFATLAARRYRLARLCGAAQVALIIVGWGAAQYPYLIPPDLTIAGAAAPPRALHAVAVAVALGAFIIFPSLYAMLRVFKLRRASR